MVSIGDFVDLWNWWYVSTGTGVRINSLGFGVWLLPPVLWFLFVSSLVAWKFIDDRSTLPFFDDDEIGLWLGGCTLVLVIICGLIALLLPLALVAVAGIALVLGLRFARRGQKMLRTLADHKHNKDTGEVEPRVKHRV